MLNDPPTVDASSSRANAKKDETPMTFATVTASLLSIGTNMETNISMLNAEKSIGHKLEPNIRIPYRQADSVVIDKNNFSIGIMQFYLSEF